MAGEAGRGVFCIHQASCPGPLPCPESPPRSHLIMVNIAISCDHNSLFNPGLRYPTFDSLKPKGGDHMRKKEKKTARDYCESSTLNFNLLLGAG